MSVQGKVVIVTGAGHPRGIGRAIALTMARDGADLVLADVNGEGAAAIAEEVRALGRQALAVATDVSKEEDVNAMVEAALGEFGRIDVLVNNAGISRYQQVLDLSLQEWNLIMAINLTGPFLCTRAVLPAMIRQGGGRVVFISSHVAISGSGLKNGAHYAASKAGVIGFAKSVARQFAHHGITSNVVAPGPIDTDISRESEPRDKYLARRQAQVSEILLGRIGVTQDVADAVWFLASDRASYITGEVLLVNGGMLIC